MSQKLYLWTLRIGSYLGLITVFFVFKSLLFPYITSKQISFNILIETLFIFWLAFIIKYPAWRPKFSLITIGIGAFMLVATISCFTGLDFNLSFWGDVERMLGVFHILHFFVFYLIIITVMRSWRDWQIFFIASALFALVVSLKSLSGDAYATIGNTAYVSGYLIFNLYFCLLLFFREENKGLRWLYLLPIPFYLLAFQNQYTSGAYVGLGFSVLMAFLFYVIFLPNRKLKISALGIFITLVAVTGLLFAYKNTDFVRENKYLSIVTGITFKKSTFQTRLISWRAAAKDFPSHPVLGTGFGNYAVIFDKYFDPKFFNYTRAETYFDRAHNNVIDIASTTGILGGLAYLFIFGAALFYLWRGYFRKRIGLHEFVLLNCLLIAYFVQNLAVFDSLVTYIGSMMTLGFIYYLVRPDRDEEEDVKDEPLVNREIYALALAGLALITIMYQYNIKPFKMLVATIDGQRAYQQGGIMAATEEYKRALSYNTVLDRDSRTSYNRLFVSNPNELKEGLSRITDKNSPDYAAYAKKMEEVINYNIELAEANVAYNKNDSLNQLLLAQILNIAAGYYTEDAAKFEHYWSRALAAIDAAIAASPGRVPVYFQKAQVYLTKGDKEQAIAVMKEAVALNEKYPDSYCYLGRIYLHFKMETEGFETLDKCLDLNGADLVLNNADYLKSILPHYADKNDYPRMIAIYDSLSRIEPKNTQIFINLAKLYEQTGNIEKAMTSAAKVKEIDPSTSQYVDEFIAGLSQQ